MTIYALTLRPAPQMSAERHALIEIAAAEYRVDGLTKALCGRAADGDLQGVDIFTGYLDLAEAALARAEAQLAAARCTSVGF